MYIYLTDYDSKSMQGSGRSRWFTRGWTLQELLAPRKVDFYNALGDHLGDKTTLVDWIVYATGIPSGALQGQPLGSFSVEQRLSWAQQRQTNREEDGAYSLLGIFDVSMPLVYGEGKDKAYGRLLYEVESSGQTQQVFQRCSQFLPSIESPDLAKAVGTNVNLAA
jgi:hypothetical protein